MTDLRTIRLELARTKEHPAGDPRCGYEFSAPLTTDGHLDDAAFKTLKDACRVSRFWAGEKSEDGCLLHLGPNRWAFSYAVGRDDDEPVFKLDDHRFVLGEYVSITEHDGITRPFKVVSLR
jgi:hypothetical protein